MKIKQETSERMVIAPSVVDRLVWTPLLGLTILLGYGAITELITPNLLWLIISIILGSHSLSRCTIHGKSCTIDKTLGTIVLTNRYFLFFPSRRKIPLERVTSVKIKRVLSWPGQWYSVLITTWKLFICTGDKTFQIDKSQLKEHIRYLTNDLASFLGVTITGDLLYV